MIIVCSPHLLFQANRSGGCIAIPDLEQVTIGDVVGCLSESGEVLELHSDVVYCVRFLRIEF